MVRDKLRLGKVSYKNTLPLFYDWKLPPDRFQIVEGTPSELASKLNLGMLDGGIISTLYFVQNKSRFALMPDVSISSFGPVKSVLIFSEKPLEKIETLRPSAESLSSNFIVYSLFRGFLKRKTAFVKDGRKTDAVLVIGDRALEMAKRKTHPYVYDVGQLWFEFTNLPAVFALFIVPLRWTYEYPQLAAQLALTLIESKEKFFKNLESMDFDEELKEYLRNLNYNFGEEHLKSVLLLEELFHRYVRGEL
jgi:chorismate dehydratase